MCNKSGFDKACENILLFGTIIFIIMMIVMMCKISYASNIVKNELVRKTSSLIEASIASIEESDKKISSLESQIKNGSNVNFRDIVSLLESRFAAAKNLESGCVEIIKNEDKVLDIDPNNKHLKYCKENIDSISNGYYEVSNHSLYKK